MIALHLPDIPSKILLFFKNEAIMDDYTALQMHHLRVEEIERKRPLIEFRREVELEQVPRQALNMFLLARLIRHEVNQWFATAIKFSGMEHHKLFLRGVSRLTGTLD